MWVSVALLLAGFGTRLREVKSVGPCRSTPHCTVTVYATVATPAVR